MANVASVNSLVSDLSQLVVVKSTLDALQHGEAVHAGWGDYGCGGEAVID